MTPRKLRLHFKKLKSVGHSSNNHPQKTDPSNPGKQQQHLVLGYHLLNKYINAAYNWNKVLSYYPLPNITDLIERLQNCKMFSSLDLRSGYHHIGLTPKAKPRTTFVTTSRKWHWNMAPFEICSLPGVICYLMSQVLSGLDFCFVYLDNILIYSTSWEEQLQHLETVFHHLMQQI